MQYKTAQLFDLSIPAPNRLAMMKRAFADHAKDYPHCPEGSRPKSWRGMRGTTHHSVAAYTGSLAQGLNSGSPVWYTHTGPQFRGEKFIHECDGFRKNYTGWYTEHDGTTGKDGSGLAKGIIALLPHGRVIAGYWWGDNGERVYFPEIYDDLDDAIDAADEHARVFAESSQEDSQKQEDIREAEEAVEDLSNTKEELVKRMKEAAALRHDERFPYARQRYKELATSYREKCEEYRKAEQALKELEEE